jgi:hypothetical protein
MSLDFIIEDVESDEENEFDLDFGLDLVKEDPVQNVVVKHEAAIVYRPLPSYTKQPSSQEIPPINPQKKQVSYDDILSSMNMRVKDGKLELIQKQPGNQTSQSIYNSYFNDSYASPSLQQPQVKRPLTQQEARAIMMRRQIAIQNQRQRINQIKSKKLLFSDNNIHFSGGYVNRDMNKLFKFVGKR